MKHSSAVEKMNELKQREYKALLEIADFARTIVPILKDKQMIESAKVLESQLFIFESIKQELQTHATNNVIELLEYIFRGE